MAKSKSDSVEKKEKPSKFDIESEKIDKRITIPLANEELAQFCYDDEECKKEAKKHFLRSMKLTADEKAATTTTKWAKFVFSLLKWTLIIMILYAVYQFIQFLLDPTNMENMFAKIGELIADQIGEEIPDIPDVPTE